jgi:hypothetical protein
VKELDPVEVYCRIKPLTTESGCIRILNDQTVALVPPDNLHNAWKQGTAKEGHYSFKQVYDEAVSQKAIFDSIALPLVDVSRLRSIKLRMRHINCVCSFIVITPENILRSYNF